jgi:hypothetical protein
VAEIHREEFFTMNRFVLAVTALGLSGIAFTPQVRADEWNKKTIITVEEPIQIPNTVLAPGKYVMKLLDSPSDRHIVQIYNADENQLITTVLAIPNYQIQPKGKTILTFWETAPGQPKALRAWFYPGDNFGQEFAYPKTEASQIAAVSHQTVPTTEAPIPAELPSATVANSQPTQEAAENTPPPPPTPARREVAAAPQTTAPAPEPVPQEADAAPRELPETASPYPLVGWAGVLALGMFALIRAFRLS